MAWTNLGTVAPGDVLRANSGTAAYNNVIGNLNDIGGAWTSFTPSWTNVTLGSGATNTGAYLQAGKTIIVRAFFVLGSGGDVTGAITMTLPNSTTYKSAYDANWLFLSDSIFRDESATTNFTGAVRPGSTNTTVTFTVNATSGTFAATNTAAATVPFDWVATDALRCHFIYEAA